MDEYSRIIIEQYYMTHNSKRRDRIWGLLKLSYSMENDPNDADALFLERAIDSEKNPELKRALIDLDEYLF